ncbi:MAG: hypothetical protein HY917_04660 [Candidatus Diapherotrites archaeon]|nr:hypothetical protein [Candidatus Diapherotrites archaeon]
MKKGQIFSLDFMLAAAITFTALAILIHTTETQQLENQEWINQSGLQSIAVSASDRLTSTLSPCTAGDLKVRNCIYVQAATLQKKDLGLPAKYCFNFSPATDSRMAGLFANGTISPIPATADIVAIDRWATLSTTPTVSPPLSLTPKKITLEVWKC